MESHKKSKKIIGYFKLLVDFYLSRHWFNQEIVFETPVKIQLKYKGIVKGTSKNYFFLMPVSTQIYTMVF